MKRGADEGRWREMREIRKKGKKKMGDSNRGVVIKMHLTENMVSRGWGLVVKEESLNQGFWQEVY